MFEARHSNLLERFSTKFPPPWPGSPDDAYRDWTQALAEQFKHDFPAEDWGTKKAGASSPDSTDVIATQNPFTGYDVLINAGAPNQYIELHPAEIHLGPPQVFVPVTAINHLGGAPGTHTTLLGASFFYGVRAFRDKWPHLERNLDWIAGTLRADYIRVFASIGALQNPDDIWVHAGPSYTWHDWVAQARGFADLVIGKFGRRIQWTISGGPEGFESDAALDANCRRFRDIMRGYEAHIELVECMNEYAVNNGGDRDKGRHILRGMARALEPHMNGVRLALSSPDSCMGGDPSNPEIADEVFKMYGGLPPGVNAITPHWSRHQHHPEWHRPPKLGSFCPKYVYGNEGIGPASSVVETYDAAQMAGHYESAISAGYAGWLLHADALIWSDRIPSHYYIPAGTGEIPRGAWANIFDVPNIEEIARRLREVRETGSSSGGGGGGTPGDVDPLVELEHNNADNDMKIHIATNAMEFIERNGWGVEITLVHLGVIYGKFRQHGKTTDEAGHLCNEQLIAWEKQVPGPDEDPANGRHIGHDLVYELGAGHKEIYDYLRIGGSNTFGQDRAGILDFGCQFGSRLEARYDEPRAYRESGEWLGRYYAGPNPWA